MSEDRKSILEKEIRLYNADQLAIKKLLNALYGSFGCAGAYLANKDIAESYAGQGRDLILYIMKAINDYFHKAWHLDTELHNKLGISTKNVVKIDESIDLIPYGITDSSFIDFDTIIKSVNGLCLSPIDEINFSITVIKERLSPFLANKLDKYAQSYGLKKNYMVFEFENISESMIFVSKSHYAYRVIYDGEFVTPKVEAKGLPCVMPSHPKKAREILMKCLEIIFDKNGKPILELDLIPYLQTAFKDFKRAKVDDICANKYVNSFNNYVIKKDLYRVIDSVNGRGVVTKNAINIKNNQYYKILTEKKGHQIAEITDVCGDYLLVKGVSQEIKGCVDYNNNITASGNSKYVKIKNGDKVKVYCSTKGSLFCYPIGNFNENICLPIDYEEQFFKVVIAPLNAILEVINISSIGKDLKRIIRYKKPTAQLIRKYGTEDCVPFVCFNSKTNETVDFPQKLFKYAVLKKDIPDYMIETYEKYINCFGQDLIIKPKDEA